MTKDQVNSKKGVSIRTLDIILIVIAFCVAAVLLYVSYKTIQGYNSLNTANERDGCGKEERKCS